MDYQRAVDRLVASGIMTPEQAQMAVDTAMSSTDAADLLEDFLPPDPADAVIAGLEHADLTRPTVAAPNYSGDPAYRPRTREVGQQHPDYPFYHSIPEEELFTPEPAPGMNVIPRSSLFGGNRGVDFTTPGSVDAQSGPLFDRMGIFDGTAPERVDTENLPGMTIGTPLFEQGFDDLLPPGRPPVPGEEPPTDPDTKDGSTQHDAGAGTIGGAGLDADAKAAAEDLNFLQQFAQDKFGWDEDKRSDMSAALIRAGAAMMAGDSPYALQNIGAGVAAGQDAYFDSKGDREKGEREARLMEMQEAEFGLSQEASRMANEKARRELEKKAGLYDRLPKELAAVEQTVDYYMSRGIPEKEARDMAYRIFKMKDQSDDY